MSLNPHQLRDERRRGRIKASIGPGRKILYTRSQLLDYLDARRWKCDLHHPAPNPRRPRSVVLHVVVEVVYDECPSAITSFASAERNGVATFPPYNRDAERSVLGSMLRDNDVIDQIALVLRISDFYTNAHQKIYTAIVQLYRLWRQG